MLLGISRAPARDALKILESQGLVVVRSGGRFVTTLTEQDVRDLHELRCALETLAIRLAASRDRDNAHRERDVTTDLQDHRNLVELVGAGDQQGAEAEMERHLDRSLSNSYGQGS